MTEPTRKTGEVAADFRTIPLYLHRRRSIILALARNLFYNSR